MILIGKGILTALDPLCAQVRISFLVAYFNSTGQAYGAKRYRAVGIALQRGVLAVVLVTFPISWSWWRAEDALLWLRQVSSRTQKMLQLS